MLSTFAIIKNITFLNIHVIIIDNNDHLIQIVFSTCILPTFIIIKHTQNNLLAYEEVNYYILFLRGREVAR